MSKKDIDKALLILQKTNDGDDLSPMHLKMVEMYVNGHLNERGLQEFEKIYESVAAETYKEPFHLGVEHMTYDHEGYIYFKGQHVEHYSRGWAYSLDAKKQLIDLQQRCLFLEERGFEVNSVSVIWGWDGHAAKFGEQKKGELDKLIPSGEKIIFSEVIAGAKYGDAEKFIMTGHPDESEVRTSPRYGDFVAYDKLNGNEAVTVVAYSYGNGVERNATAEEMAALELCFGYLKDNGLLSEREGHIYLELGNVEQGGDDDYMHDEDEYER